MHSVKSSTAVLRISPGGDGLASTHLHLNSGAASFQRPRLGCCSSWAAVRLAWLCGDTLVRLSCFCSPTPPFSLGSEQRLSGCSLGSSTGAPLGLASLLAPES